MFKKIIYVLLVLIVFTGCNSVALDRTAITQDLTIVLRDGIDDLEPTQTTLIARTFLTQIFEGLVGLDADMRIVPRLAESWGNITDTTWEFHLRHNVMFHDGSEFDAQDVVASIKRAKTYAGSEAAAFLENIIDVTIKSDDTLTITTRLPDPVLLHKLLFVFIIPAEIAESASNTTITRIVGTGPYELVEHLARKKMKVKKFDNYWRDVAGPPRASLVVVPDKFDREEMLKKKEADILFSVPPTAFNFIQKSNDFNLITGSGLDIHFLSFNQKTLDQPFREAIKLAIDRSRFVETAKGLIDPAYQVVSSSVFGFSPQVHKYPVSIKLAKEKLKASKVASGLVLNIILEKANNTIGQIVQNMLAEIGVETNILALSPAKFVEELANADADIVMMGWQFDTSDAGDYLLSFYHSHDDKYGGLNNFGIHDTKIDDLLEKASVNLDATKRLKQLQKAVEIIAEQVMTVPLYETKRVLAVSSSLFVKPRIDGTLYLADITQK